MEFFKWHNLKFEKEYDKKTWILVIDKNVLDH